jgi:hypothetical protein
MPCPRPTVKFDLLSTTTFNETKPDWTEPDSLVAQELKDSIVLYAYHVLKYAYYELPSIPRVDAYTAKDLVSMFMVWRDVKYDLTPEEQQYFWNLDLGARALLYQLPPREYTKQLRFGYRSNLTSNGFVGSTRTAINETNKEGVYERIVGSMRESLDALALQIHADKYNDVLKDNYLNLHYQLHNLDKQVAMA